ncbi:hypothetical protein [Clostridium estertheticum]|nr:hypothetical protein [Clostridium estertheticum]MBU3217861.1 hypothetical protein [Clostridium estertheticum]
MNRREPEYIDPSIIKIQDELFSEELNDKSIVDPYGVVLAKRGFYTLRQLLPKKSFIKTF